MKSLFMFVVMAMFIMGTSIAGESTTECPMMKEMNERNNPKSGLNSAKIRPKKTKPTAVQQ